LLLNCTVYKCTYLLTYHQCLEKARSRHEGIDIHSLWGFAILHRTSFRPRQTQRKCPQINYDVGGQPEINTAAETGNTNISVINRIEIPTANLGFLTTASSIKVFPKIATIIDTRKWSYSCLGANLPILRLSPVVRRCRNSLADTFSELVVVENAYGNLSLEFGRYGRNPINVFPVLAAISPFPVVGLGCNQFLSGLKPQNCG